MLHVACHEPICFFPSRGNEDNHQLGVGKRERSVLFDDFQNTLELFSLEEAIINPLLKDFVQHSTPLLAAFLRTGALPLIPSFLRHLVPAHDTIASRNAEFFVAVVLVLHDFQVNPDSGQSNPKTTKARISNPSLV